MAEDRAGEIELLHELVAWTKLQARDKVIRALDEVLSTENDYRIYELTDGTRNGAEVARTVGVSKTAVSQKWKLWRQAGLLVEVEGTRGPRHLASRESLGQTP